MKEVMELVMKSNDYLLGRIHEKASLIELEQLARLRLETKQKPKP